MKKMFLLAVLALGVSTAAMAQLSDATPSKKTFKVGNRAQAGDFGIYLGVGLDKFKKIGDNTKVEPLPLINLKYMKTDNIEYRLGIEMYKESELVTYSEEIPTEEGSTKSIDNTYKNLESYFRFTPGVAYHFSKSNILDVYAGAEALVGWERDVDYLNSDDEYVAGSKGSKFALNVGCGAFIGLQAYIGDLPLALGLEYGVQSIWELGQSYTIETKDNAVYSYSNNKGFSASSDDLSASKFKLGHQVRLTLSYYFK